MKNYTFNIEDKIVDKFRLFVGLRDVEEDKKILEKVSGLCFDEAVSFLLKNISDMQVTKLLNELDKIDRKNLNDYRVQKRYTKVFLKYMRDIDNYSFKFDKRINYFINQLVYKAVKEKN